MRRTRYLDFAQSFTEMGLRLRHQYLLEQIAHPNPNA
ncbi:hypothetical protein BamIOP4010DRAFT_3472 [Burkholderia ambifaria IOP40-10]|uniref:Uncharacterized protein n=1 Tax=Burkholderia ambifaria IOP40-10 TaxID=396596 RepID=B1FHE8_9BURK|nr:hypothetical protein BamIOP4010DRAFT_3472 [Burkholderia ambifaria IOP40-10]